MSHISKDAQLICELELGLLRIYKLGHLSMFCFELEISKKNLIKVVHKIYLTLYTEYDDEIFILYCLHYLGVYTKLSEQVYFLNLLLICHENY